MKSNELYLQQQEKQFEQELSFAEWLDYFAKEPTEQELDDMEQESKKKKPYRFQALNNPYYYPLQGA